MWTYRLPSQSRWDDHTDHTVPYHVLHILSPDGVRQGAVGSRPQAYASSQAHMYTYSQSTRPIWPRWFPRWPGPHGSGALRRWVVGLSKPISWCKQRNGNAGLGYNLTQCVSDTSTHAAYVKSLQPDVIDKVQCLWHMEHVARQTRQMLLSIILMLEVWFQVFQRLIWPCWTHEEWKEVSQKKFPNPISIADVGCLGLNLEVGHVVAFSLVSYPEPEQVFEGTRYS